MKPINYLPIVVILSTAPLNTVRSEDGPKPDPWRKYETFVRNHEKESIEKRVPVYMELVKSLTVIFGKAADPEHKNLAIFIDEIIRQGDFEALEKLESSVNDSDRQKIMWIRLGIWVRHDLETNLNSDCIQKGLPLLNKWALPQPRDFELEHFPKV